MGQRRLRAVRLEPRRMMIFPIGGSGQRLVFSPTVVEHFLQFRQMRWWQRKQEASYSHALCCLTL